ncbi:MAG: FAD-binding protein, partial [Muribaculaceae bacterium]|nr:FAD-binding protein [Muribaculaceae bacterium]
MAGVGPERIVRCDLIRRSIDARQRRIMVNITLDLHIDTEDKRDALVPEPPHYSDVSNAPQAVVVGAGPAGLFAALELIELGIRPIVIERGKDVDERRRDMAAISRTQTVDPESNYCFGEGGAGAFSDGKLYTRSTKRGPADKVLQLLYHHGARRDILVDSHPHIGTDRLPDVIKNIRHTIEKNGGCVLFRHKATDLIIGENGSAEGVVLSDGSRIAGPVILATGHSARDVYQMLRRHDIEMHPKGIAVGVRLEHPQQLIDRIQYHNPQGRGKYLPPAEYSM